MFLNDEKNIIIFITIWWINSQVNGYVWYSFITTGNSVSFCFNFTTDFIKIHEFFSFAVQKFRIFYNKIKIIISLINFSFTILSMKIKKKNYIYIEKIFIQLFIYHWIKHPGYKIVQWTMNINGSHTDSADKKYYRKEVTLTIGISQGK